MGVTKVSRLLIGWDGIQKAKSRSEPAALPRQSSDRKLYLVVFVFVDAVADVILAAIQLVLLRLGQMTVVLGHVSLFLPLHAGFTPLQVGSLVRTQRTVLDSVGDALLLVSGARVHFIHTRMARIDDSRPGA